MRGGRKDAHVELLVDVEQVADVFSQHAPLVIAEVIYHDQEHLLALIEQREYLALEDVGTHQMAVSVVGTHPVEIVLGYVFGETLVSSSFCMPSISAIGLAVSLSFSSQLTSRL